MHLSVQYQGPTRPKRKELRLLAIYHLSIKIITRGKGKSAVAAAAYRSGTTIKNEYDGMIHDYSRKGGIVHTEILLPENAPSEYADRSTLWNAIEKAERYKTAFMLARKFVLPMNPPRMELYEALRFLFAEHGISIKKARFNERRPRTPKPAAASKLATASKPEKEKHTAAPAPSAGGTPNKRRRKRKPRQETL